MNDRLFKNTKEFYNRTDLILELKPFTLIEIAKFLKLQNNQISTTDIINYYSMFGGIIKYYYFLDFFKSFEDNFKSLLKDEKIRHLIQFEKEILLDSIFSKKRLHQEILKILCSSKSISVDNLVDKLWKLKKNQHIINDFKNKENLKTNLYKELKGLTENGLIK